MCAMFRPSVVAILACLARASFVQEYPQVSCVGDADPTGLVQVQKRSVASDTQGLPALSGLPVQCLQEHVEAVESYYTELAGLNVKGIVGLFAPSGFVVSQRYGVTTAMDFYGGALPHLAAATVKTIGIFCSLSADTSVMIGVKHNFTLRQIGEEADETGIYVDMFRIESGTTPTKLHSVEMYENNFVTESLSSNPTSPMGPSFGPGFAGACAQENVDLVRQYLRLLVEQDAAGVAKLFAPEGFMVGSRKGRVDALSYFKFFLSSVSDVVVSEIAIFCGLNPTSTSTPMAVNFYIDYTVVESGQREGGITLDILYVKQGDGTKPPTFLSAEMFDDENVEFFSGQ